MTRVQRATREPKPGKLALFLLESDDAGLEEELARFLETLEFDVQRTRGAQPDVELDIGQSVFAIIALTGTPTPSRRSRARETRLATPGLRVAEASYAVVMSGVPIATHLEGVGYVGLDGERDWRDVLAAVLRASGWLA